MVPALAVLAATVGVHGRIGHAEDPGGLPIRLMPDGRPGNRVSHPAADQRRGGGMIGTVGRLRGGRGHRLQEVTVPQSDDVDQVAGLQPRKADQDLAVGFPRDDDDLGRFRRPFVHEQFQAPRCHGAVRPGRHDRAGDPAYRRPYLIRDSPAWRALAYDHLIAGM
jgi:hypothetical protein